MLGMLLGAIFIFLTALYKLWETKIKQERGWVEIKPSMPLPKVEKKGKKKVISLDHGLLLMFFISCKRKKIK